MGIKNLDQKATPRVQQKTRFASQGKRQKKQGSAMQVSGTIAESSSPASKLIHWLATRSTVDLPISTEEISQAIGSRRNTKTVIAAAIKLGILQQKEDKFTQNNAKNTRKTTQNNALNKTHEHPGMESVGQVDVHPLQTPVRESTTLIGVADRFDSRNPRNAPTQSQDLRVRQIEKFAAKKITANLSSSPLPATTGASAPCTEHIIFSKRIYMRSTLTKANNNILNNININNISPRARTRSKQRASSPSQISKNQNRQAIKAAQDAQLAARVQAVISAPKFPGEAPSAAFAAESRAYGIAMAYEDCLGIYVHKPTLRYITGRVNSSSPNFKRWLAAADAADSLGANYAQYVKSQFWWFDKAFSRAPKPYELSGGKGLVPASERFGLFVEAIRAGSVNLAANVVGRVVATIDTTTKAGRSRMSQVRASQAVRSGNSERTLRAFMKNYNASEEWVLKTFAKGQLAAQYFDLAWLKTNPTYQRLRKSGEL